MCLGRPQEIVLSGTNEEFEFQLRAWGERDEDDELLFRGWPQLVNVIHDVIIGVGVGVGIERHRRRTQKQR